MSRLAWRFLMSALPVALCGGVMIAMCLWASYTAFLSAAGVVIVHGVPMTVGPMFPFSFWLDPLAGAVGVLGVVIFAFALVKVIGEEVRFFWDQYKRHQHSRNQILHYSALHS